MRVPCRRRQNRRGTGNLFLVPSTRINQFHPPEVHILSPLAQDIGMMSDGNICTIEEQALSNSSNGTSIVCLTRGDTIGLTLVAESGLISLVAVLGVFVLIFRNAFRNRKLIRHPTDLYMLSLFTFDLIMASGRVIDTKWIHEGKVYTGNICTVQGSVQQLGETGSALATLTIAVHTFVVILWGPRKRQYLTAYATVGLTWLFLVLFIAISVSLHTHGSNVYENPDGYWCWIGDRYSKEQFAGQYVWVWTTVVVSFLTYTPLFVWARGNISVSPTHWWKFRVHKGKDVVKDIDPDGRKKRSIGMIVYPLVFAVITLPLSAVRLRTGFGSTTRHLPTATFVVEFIYSLSGALNVILFLSTRSELLLPRNVSSKVSRSGVAPDIRLTDTHADITDLTIASLEVRQRSRGLAPVPLGSLPKEEDSDWHLPVSGSDSEDTV
ncbi:hypothetical protein PILCRDRAFT_828227 [Piloderma croceum F 1598]|uniref:G-protein coupled receptors family 1 profile domain-containing protein n=1 Tax=Piloderma croceum (strain F 1598) TaxID=765440 RepID=A0A0C3AKG7_PILCF|nr:hypothetical protein PILCRDRAFT_828227 [Piloderma croceum F 1598]